MLEVEGLKILYHRSCRSTIVMDGKANRISSVKNTKKITMVMKLVAAAKVRRAQDSSGHDWRSWTLWIIQLWTDEEG